MNQFSPRADKDFDNPEQYYNYNIMAQDLLYDSSPSKPSRVNPVDQYENPVHFGKKLVPGAGLGDGLGHDLGGEDPDERANKLKLKKVGCDFKLPCRYIRDFFCSERTSKAA
jgi:hypothetical protein